MTAGNEYGPDETVQEAGVNPLGGCIPALLQIRYSLPCSVSLIPRLVYVEHISFVKDLSAYDTVIKFGTNIPFTG